MRGLLGEMELELLVACEYWGKKMVGEEGQERKRSAPGVIIT